ncbi:hypothetical protein ABTM12_19735, partial [Acinetobacter baumannii]
MTIQGLPADDVNVTESLVGELAKRTSRVCPLLCKSGETLENEVCVAVEKAKPANEASTPARPPKPDKRQAEREERKPKPVAAPA